MTRRSTTIAAGALAVLGAAALLAPAGPVTADTASAATSALQRDLQLMRDEERMARDLYRVIAAKYDGLLPFSRITRAEQQHFTSVGTMLTRYRIADPARGKTAGRYRSAEIQRLYDGWKARAMTSKEEAFRVGIELEKRDIADLRRAIGQTTNGDVKFVYQRLLNGSQNHLRAFTAAQNGTLPSMQANGRRAGGTGLARGARMAGDCQGQGAQQGRRPGAGQGRGPGAQQGRRGRGMQGTGTRQGPGQGRGMGAGPQHTPGDCPNAPTTTTS